MDVQACVLPLFKFPDAGLNAAQKRVALDVSDQSISTYAELIDCDLVTLLDVVSRSWKSH